MGAALALTWHFLVLLGGMAWSYGCVRLAEMVAPRSQFDAKSQLRSLRFWPFYAAASICAYQLDFMIRSGFDLKPLLAIDGEAIYEYSGLGYLNYVVWPLVSLAVVDFFHYWKHRAQHRFFWRYHAVHHSIENLSAINSYHHWTDPFFSLILATLPMAILIGMDFPMFAVVATLLSLQGAFIHANTSLHLGPFNRLLVDNRFHRIHHSTDAQHFNKNFGERVTIWDQIFGTAHFPTREEWPDSGLSDEAEPRQMSDYLWRPFVRRRAIMSAKA